MCSAMRFDHFSTATTHWFSQKRKLTVSCVVWKNALKLICINDLVFCFFAFTRFTQNTMDRVNSTPDIFYLHPSSNLKQNLNKQLVLRLVYILTDRKKDYLKFQNRNTILYACAHTHWQKGNQGWEPTGNSWSFLHWKAAHFTITLPNKGSGFSSGTFTVSWQVRTLLRKRPSMPRFTPGARTPWLITPQ